MSDRLRTACVVGDGIAGWSAACALAGVAGLRVAMVAAGPPDEVVDRMVTSTPATVDFHHDIGLDPRDLMTRAGARPRSGSLFRGWAATDYVHAYGPVGAAIEGVPFAALWPRHAGAPFDAYSPAARLGRAGRMPPCDPLFDGVAHGIRIDPATYRAYLSSYARHRGVMAAAAPLATARRDGARVAALVLADGSELSADLYVDATGTEARLSAAQHGGGAWHDWRDLLPCNALRWTAEAPDGLLDVVTAHATGWAMPGVWVGQGAIGGAQPLAQGRRAKAWIGNVVAVGQAYALVEPLHAAPLHLLHTQLDRLVATLPGRDFAAVELDHYNRETAQEADRLRDFVALPYLVATRDEPFWQARRAAPPPPELAHTLALFRARGRLPVRDGEGFARDDWRAILFGAGVMPVRTDAVAAPLDPAHVARAMQAFRQHLDAAVAGAPPA